MDGETPGLEQVDHTVSLTAVLARVRGELIDLGRCADDLQATISAITAASPSAVGLDAQIRLQAADALAQRLDRLARLAEILETTVPPAWTLDPMSDDDLGRELSRLADAERAPPGDGDCEMF
jgi:hypothetical protein